MTERGQYNASCTVYGYRKSKKDKHKLEIELEKAGIVADIEQKGRDVIYGEAGFVNARVKSLV